MWKTKLSNFFNFFRLSPTTKRYLWIGGSIALLPWMLNYASAFQLMLGIMIFAMFSMYLYVNRLSKDIVSLRAEIDVMKAESGSEKLSEEETEKMIIPDTSSKTEPREKKQEGTQFGKKKDAPLYAKIEKIRERLEEGEKNLNMMHSSIQNLAKNMHLDDFAKEGPIWSQAETDVPSKHELDEKLEEINAKVETIPTLESQITELHESLHSLGEIKDQQEEVKGFRSDLKVILKIMRQFQTSLSHFEKRLISDEEKLESLSKPIPNPTPTFKLIRKEDIRPNLRFGGRRAPVKK